MANIKDAVTMLEIVADELTYLPTAEQRKAKSAFYARFNDNPLCEPGDISLAVALQFCPDARLNKWWPIVGFREWFRNRDEFKQRMEYLSQLALDSLEMILVDPKAQGSAKVNAAKLIMEVSRKMPSKSQVEQYLDEKIHQMDKKQLQEYIHKSLKAVEPLPLQPSRSQQDLVSSGLEDLKAGRVSNFDPTE